MMIGVVLVGLVVLSSAAAAASGPLGEDSSCQEALQSQLFNLSAPNSLVMLDAWGKLPAGVIGDFNLYSFGSYSSCTRLGLQVARYCSLYGPQGLFLYLNVSSSQPLPFLPNKASVLPVPLRGFGVCVPSACDENSLGPALISHHESAGIVVDFGLAGEALISCSNDDKVTDSKMSTFFAVLFILIVVVGVVCSFLDEFGIARPKISWTKKLLESEINQNGLLDPDVAFNEESGLLGNQESDLNVASADVPAPSHAHSFFQWFVESFSFTRNFSSLLKTKPFNEALLKRGEPDMSAMEGFKVMSTLWVIFGHMYFWIILGAPVQNYPDLIAKFDETSFLLVINAFFSVDSFFFFSGFLAAYGIEQRLKGGRPFGVKESLMAYLLRYIRIMPSYFLVMMYLAYISQYTGSGPYWTFAVTSNQACRTTWWQNALFVDNFFSGEASGSEGCAGWGWYLSNDFQFFLLTPILVYLMHRNFKVGVSAVGLLMIGSIASCIILTIKFDLEAFWIGGLLDSISGKPHAPSGDISKYIYVKPWARIQPYLVGVVGGYLQAKKLTPLPKEKTMFWIHFAIAVAVMITCVFGLRNAQNGNDLSETANVLYISLTRATWGLALWFAVSACINNRITFLRKLMSASIFQVLARVSLLSYLVHPVILFWIYYSGTDALHYSDRWLAWNYIGVVTLSMTVALIGTAFVESPLRKVSKALLRKDD